MHKSINHNSSSVWDQRETTQMNSIKIHRIKVQFNPNNTKLFFRPENY